MRDNRFITRLRPPIEPTERKTEGLTGFPNPMMHLSPEREGVSQPLGQNERLDTIQYIIGAFRRSGASFAHSTKQFFSTILPQMQQSIIEQAGDPEEWADWRKSIAGPGGVAQKKELYEKSKELIPQLQAKYEAQEAKHQEYITTTPELKPHPKWDKPVTEVIKKDPSILKNPAYWAYIFAESAAYSASFMGTTVAVTAATGNPFLGAGAGVAATSPATINDVYQDLVNSGATPQQASLISTPLGTLIASVEIVGGFPVLKALLPQFSRLLTTNARKEIVRLTLRTLLAKGVKTFALTEITEVFEEIVQQAIQNTAVSMFDESRQILENVDETVLRTLIAVAPWGVVGGGAQIAGGIKQGVDVETPDLKREEGFARVGKEPELTPEVKGTEQTVTDAIISAGSKYVKDMGKFLEDVKGKSVKEVEALYPELKGKIEPPIVKPTTVKPTISKPITPEVTKAFTDINAYGLVDKHLGDQGHIEYTATIIGGEKSFDKIAEAMASNKAFQIELKQVLKDIGLPEQITVYRGGKEGRISGEYTNVTLDPDVAKRFGIVKTYTANLDDVVGVGKTNESELLFRTGALVAIPKAEVTPTEAPVGEVEIGDFIQLKGEIGTGLKAPRGFVVGEGTMGKNIPAWKIKQADKTITLIPKDEAVALGKEPIQPPPTAPQISETAPEAVSEGVGAEDAAVTEVSGVAPPKPPKDWDKIGGQLYDRFKKQSSNPTPNTVPLSGRMKRAYSKGQKVVTDEFARLNSLGWQAELDVAMVRASGTQSAQVYRETMKSITKSLGNNSELLSYVDDYLMLRHQLEVLKATGRKYFVIKKGEVAQRFTAKQIGLLFAQMKKELGAENYARVKEAASHVPAVYNQILRGTQELTPGQIEGLIKKYPWFNPVLFIKDTVPADINHKLSPKQIRELTTLESDKENISPLVSLPTTIARRINAFAINDAKKSIAELAVDPKNTKLIGGDVEIVAKKPEGAFIDYFDNGERKYLKLGKGSEWIAQDIELFQRQPPPMMIRMVRSLQSLSKMFFTTYNPGFVAWNTSFDGMVAYFAEGIGPWGFGKALAGNIKGMFTDVPGLNEFRRSGGELFGFFTKGSKEGAMFGEGEQVISPYVTKKKGRLVLKNPESLKRFINPFALIRELGVAGENAARRATYEKAKKEGLSAKEATLRARRVTVDFGRFSTASRFINDWFIYFNPAMQGLLLPGRAIVKNPRTLWRLAALVAGYIALTFYNQGYDEYDDVRDSDKVGKLLVMLPSNEYNKYGQKVPHYLTLLPLREFALFTAPIEYLVGRLRTEEPEAYRSLAQEFGVLYPIVTPLSMISEAGGLVMPTQIGATIQQIQQNHDDFRDRPIVDDEMALLPPTQQYDQYTNSLAIRVGQALNMSPKMLDFFVSNMFGALGQDCLRTMDLAIQGLDKEEVDERIAGLVNELRTIPTNVPPNRIEVARETFLEGLSVEDRDLVLNMERLPDDKLPFMASLVRRFIKDYGGQVYQTAKEKALAARTIDDYPPEALEELQKAAVENANNLLADKITKYQYDQNRSRYRAYYSGAGTAEWRQGMIEGAVARADIDKFMPEAYKRAKEFQAVSAFMEIRQKYIDKAGGVFDSDMWDKIEQDTLSEMRSHYSEVEIQYALDHKDDWIDKLPEPARTLERRRAREIEDETWWDNYREAKKPTTPSRSTQPSTFKSRLIER